jgi:CHAT domain-containing protein
VVATEWSVDDQAAAILVDKFCQIVAAAWGKGQQADFGQALKEAKLHVRNFPGRPNWDRPFYWAPFILIGPQ